MDERSRRGFLWRTAGLAAAVGALGPLGCASLRGRRTASKPGANMKWGMVTYLWGKDWDLPTLIANCEKTDTLGVELRTEHAHGVEPSLSAAERSEVKKRFADSPVVLLGPGTNQNYDMTDQDELKASIEGTKAFIKLSHDTGGTGVKVKPNNLPKGVAQEKTVEQIGKSLNIVGAYGADYGQEIRLEVHGQCAPLPIIKQIMDVADHPNVTACWNCNKQDTEGEGLAHNFGLVKDRFGATAHVRELNEGDYPYAEAIALFVAMDYDGWILLEARTKPEDRVVALAEQRKVFDQMVAQAQAAL